jgi:aspartyl-tRNA synthetase
VILPYFLLPFRGGGSVQGITAKNAFSILTRKEIDRLTDFSKGNGAKGLAWIRWGNDDTILSSFGKFISQDSMQAILSRAEATSGDVVFLVADAKNALVLSVLGALRIELARQLQLIPKNVLHFLWVTDFPFFDWDEDSQQFVAMHHPFTAPTQETSSLLETDKAGVIAQAADLVLNGIELSSGSIRITDPVLQARIFALLGLTEEDIARKFGFLINAFRFGAPPHGGMGIGLDRLIMQLLGCESLRDVVAFPKVQNATEPMTNCPSAVDTTQLFDLGIQLLDME